MKTNKNNISERAKNGRNGKQLVYVLDCIRNSASAFDNNVTFENDKEVIAFFFEKFEDGFNHAYNKRLYPNLQVRIGHYLQGLPSCCSVEYFDNEILRLGLAWGVLDSTEGRKAEKFVENYWDYLGLRIIQIAHKVDFNLTKYYL